MYKMILDTATHTLYASLLRDDEILEEYYIEGRNDHAKNVVDVVDKMLKNSNLNINDIDEFYAGIGPGSYTGVRMAVTVGKMISTNTKARLYSFSSLYMMSSGYDGKVLPYIDARRGNSFNALYDGEEIVLEEALRSTEETINNNSLYKPIDESMIKVNPIKLMRSASLCENPHGLAPNYLRDTEAERNLNK